jgi:hypothetical protein
MLGLRRHSTVVFSKQRVKYYYTIDVKYFLNYQRENEWTSNYIDNFTENKKKFTALFYYAMCVCVHVCVCVCVCVWNEWFIKHMYNLMWRFSEGEWCSFSIILLLFREWIRKCSCCYLWRGRTLVVNL